MTTITVHHPEPDSSASTLKVRRLQPLIGAELDGVDLRQPLSAADRDAIYAAILEHRVVFFCGQDISRQQQIGFARSFGDLEIHPFHTDPDYPEILQIAADGKRARGADIWHSDHSYEQYPPSITTLRAVTVPSLGGDTVFSNAVAAYDGLPDEVKSRIEHLTAVHSAGHGHRQRSENLATFDVMAVNALYPPRSQPVVRIHPDTGERILNVNVAYTSHVEGVDAAESRELLHCLTDQIKRPEYQLRWAWRPGSMAVWDNRAVQEYDLTDHLDPRCLERCCIAGPAPYGPVANPTGTQPSARG